VIELFTRAMERISRWLFPASGHHRALPPAARPLQRHPAPVPARRLPSDHTPPMYVDDSPLVRPYVLALDERRAYTRGPGRSPLVCPHLDTAPLDGERR
jgi:hypothetical protein